MSFVRKSKYITIVLAVVTLILVLYNLLVIFTNNQIRFLTLGAIDTNYFFKFDSPDYFIIIWEIFWFIVGGLAFYFVAKNAKNKITSESTLKKFEKYEFAWLGLALIFYIIFSFFSLPIANSIAHNGMTTDQTQVIEVTGYQFQWKFAFENGTIINSTTGIDSSTAVTFRLQSTDVSHGFSLYNENDDLQIQTGIFPDVATELTIKLDPGTYKIVCMEYCGVGHSYMIGYLLFI